MALNFSDSKGKAVKGVDSYSFKDGENSIRLFGGVLPRYLYWIKGTNNKDVPVECLSFDREKEKFTNIEKDWVKEYYPELKCSWAYAMMGYDINEKKPVVINLKKKLFEQIKTAAEDLGDPTDPDTGWDVVFKKVKTGPLAFNVEYTLQVLRCKPRALSEEEKALIEKSKSIDEALPRLTPDEQKEFIENMHNKAEDNDAANDTSSHEDVDDIPQ